MSEKKKQNADLMNSLEVSGLAFSVIFEMVAGPFIGYFIGVFLVDRFRLPHPFVIMAVALGFLAGIYNVAASIRMMKRISRQQDEPDPQGQTSHSHPSRP